MTARPKVSCSAPCPISRRFEARSRRRGSCTSRARALLEDVGGRVVAASTSLDSAAVELLAGDGATAESQLRRDYETLDSLGEKYILPTVAALLAEALYVQTRYDEALAFSETAEELGAPDDVDAQSLWRCVRAKVLARQGRLEEAEALARAAIELCADRRTRDAGGRALGPRRGAPLAGREDESRAMLRGCRRALRAQGKARVGRARGGRLTPERISRRAGARRSRSEP